MKVGEEGRCREMLTGRMAWDNTIKEVFEEKGETVPEYVEKEGAVAVCAGNDDSYAISQVKVLA